jgi:hypothetical protein
VLPQADRCPPELASLIGKKTFIEVVGAVCNRDGLGLRYAANRGYNPLPHTINLGLNLNWNGVVSQVSDVSNHQNQRFEQQLES